VERRDALVPRSGVLAATLSATSRFKLKMYDRKSSSLCADVRSFMTYLGLSIFRHYSNVDPADQRTGQLQYLQILVPQLKKRRSSRLEMSCNVALGTRVDLSGNTYIQVLQTIVRLLIIVP
jgi:hypothetical protein